MKTKLVENGQHRILSRVKTSIGRNDSHNSDFLPLPLDPPRLQHQAVRDQLKTLQKQPHSDFLRVRNHLSGLARCTNAYLLCEVPEEPLRLQDGESQLPESERHDVSHVWMADLPVPGRFRVSCVLQAAQHSLELEAP